MSGFSCDIYDILSNFDSIGPPISEYSQCFLFDIVLHSRRFEVNLSFRFPLVALPAFFGTILLSDYLWPFYFSPFVVLHTTYTLLMPHL